ncbi:MAG: CDP-alcohol phosphatidyltransferase family protein [Hyphomicrobium sp.]
MQIAAALVHLFTALGAVTALYALLAVADRNWEVAFLWLGLAFVIDGIDGTFARLVGVVERLPRFSGERLDLVVDYVTYVFIPAYALLAAGLLEGTTGRLLAAGILVSSLFHFADLESKADDYSFVGFPAVWNIVAMYLFVFQTSPAVTAAVVLLCIGLTFVPMRWMHPFRVTRFRGPVIALSVAWAIAAFVATWNGFASAPLWSKAVLLAVAIAVVVLSLVASFGRERA